MVDAWSADAWAAFEDMGFRRRVCSSLRSLRGMADELSREQQKGEGLCGHVGTQVRSLEEWLEVLSEVLDDYDGQAAEEERLRTSRLDVHRERTALATSITAALEGWVDSAEAELTALATPAARGVSLHHTWHSAPPALAFLQRETADAVDESRARLRRREADLSALLTAAAPEPAHEGATSPTGQGQGQGGLVGGRPALPPSASMPEEHWEVRKLSDLRETAEAQAKLRPLLHAVGEAQASLRAMEAEAAALLSAVGRAQVVLAARLERWDSDTLSMQWAAAAQKLHAKDRKTAALLERRRQLRERAATELNERVPATLAALPEYIAEVAISQQRCQAFTASLLPTTLLMQEEVSVADSIAIVCAEKWRAEQRRKEAAGRGSPELVQVLAPRASGGIVLERPARHHSFAP